LSTIKNEMKFKLAFSSVVVAGLMLGACGGAEESRTRNAATEICRPPGTEVVTAQLIEQKNDEREKLGVAWRASDEAATQAKKTLEEARKNVPRDLKIAVARFHASDAVITKLQKRIEDLPSWGYEASYLEELISKFEDDIAKYEKLKDQEGMNALLVKRAQQLNELVETHRKAVEEADRGFALLQEFNASLDKLYALQELPECSSIPLLSAGDAENFVQDAAEVPVTTTTERKMYQFFDEPVVGTQDSDQPMPEETSSSSSSSTSTTESMSKTPTMTEEMPVTRETLPVVVYVSPTPEEILEEVTKDLEENPVTTSTSSPPVPVGVVNELQTLVDSVIDDIQNEPASSSEPVDQTVVIAQEKEKVLVMGTVSPAVNSSGPDEGKSPVTIFAIGFAPNSYVAITDDSGTQVATGTTTEDGSVEVQAFTLPLVGGSTKVWVIGGTNADGKKIAVPVIVKTAEVATTSTSPVDPDAVGTSDNGGNSSWFSPLLGILAIVLLLVLVFFVRTRRKKSE
jgi:hypothetical protein